MRYPYRNIWHAIYIDGSLVLDHPITPEELLSQNIHREKARQQHPKHRDDDRAIKRRTERRMGFSKAVFVLCCNPHFSG